MPFNSSINRFQTCYNHLDCTGKAFSVCGLIDEDKDTGDEMKEKGKIHYAWLILIGCCAVQMMIMGTILNSASVYFLEIVKDFNSQGKVATISGLSMFHTALSLAFVLGMTIINPLLKRFNLRVVMTAGVVLAVLAQAAMAFYQHTFLWTVSGFLLGIVVPLVGAVPPTMMLMNWFQKKQGTVIAIQSAFGGIGGAIMNPLTEVLMQEFGWRTTYLITAGAVALVVLPLTLFVFRLTPAEMGLRALGSREQQPVAGDVPVREVVMTGIPAEQAKQTSSFKLIMLGMVFLGFTMSFMQFLKAYAATINWEVMGATMTSLAMIGSLLGNLLMGSLTDRFGLHKVYRGGAATIAMGLTLLIVGRSNLYVLLAGCVLYGMVQGLGAVGTPLLVRQSFGSKDYANIFSRLSRVQGLVGAFSFYGVSRLAELLGSSTLPNYAPTMAAAAVMISLLAVIMPLAIQRAPMLTRTADSVPLEGLREPAKEL